MSSFRQSQGTDLRQVIRADPSVVLRSKILALSQYELESAIEAELADNPALERLESESEPISEEQVLRAIAPQELRQRPEDNERIRCTSPDDDSTSWVELAATYDSLHDHLFAQMESELEPRDRQLAWYLVSSLNERGYLDVANEDIALATNRSLEDVEAAVARLQRCEPRGIGARNVTECLLLQLEDEDSFEGKLASRILKDHLDELIARRTAKLSRRYKVLPAVIQSAFELIGELNPNPAIGFSTCSSAQPQSRSASITPDLVLRRTDLGWEIEPIGGDPTLLAIHETYRRRSLTKKAASDPEVADHLKKYCQRAEQFLQSLKDRRRTLRQIGLYLVEKQAGFVATGRFEFLVPLTRNRLAHDVGLHESTISRATMGKYVQIANGDVVPFEVFFKPALRVQKMIEEILATENPGAPLSDEAIARILETRGVQVARRTVNKYRDKTRMLNSRSRRSA